MSNIVDAEASLTIQELCRAEKFSPAYYYKLKKRGLAPVETRIGSIIRITPEARREWHARHVKAAQTEAAQLEAARKHAQTVAAGKAAARSSRHVNARRAAARGRVTP
jgi:hypothetical protein